MFANFVFSSGVRGYFLITTSIASFVFPRVVCAVIFNYYYDCEFCFCCGWRARLFLITTIIVSFVFGWRARLFLIIITIASFVFVRVVCTTIFSYHYVYECLFFGWRARLFLKYYYYCEFSFPGGVHVFLRITITVSFASCLGGVRGYF